ncbi:hypothetical protein [Aquamicrobium sp. LC103]|uniref:hypothetical protein n=1 Tax=Aquamicrobium sp. LC103 TaxID=1120658 RepID=UPI00069935CD|nr:hypothetical protein [Aquamicrobium sp. LC103]TKT75481.1 hypothetical protein XW59_020385 [Aquamicrobium sp. LC103]
MARIPVYVSAIATCALLSVSPLASATSSKTIPQASTAAVMNETPARNADLLSMQMCGERDQVVQELAQNFNETPMAYGQVDGSAVVEIFVSDGGTWTILATGTDGNSCIVSAGEGFESTTLIKGTDV